MILTDLAIVQPGVGKNSTCRSCLVPMRLAFELSANVYGIQAILHKLSLILAGSKKGKPRQQLLLRHLELSFARIG